MKFCWKVVYDGYQYILQKHPHFKEIFPNLLIVFFKHSEHIRRILENTNNHIQNII